VLVPGVGEVSRWLLAKDGELIVHHVTVTRSDYRHNPARCVARSPATSAARGRWTEVRPAGRFAGGYRGVHIDGTRFDAKCVTSPALIGAHA
jgi:hypothetical protein